MKNQTILFGGGCFWCVEAVLQRLQGVEKVTSGYAGGSVGKASYEQVSSGATGHAEVVQVEYDPSIISLETLFDVFFSSHDSTTLNRQGADMGTQYRSAIYVQNAEDEVAAHAYIEKLKRSGIPSVTEVKRVEVFYPAEAYHQNFYNSNQNYPYCQVVIDPKIAKLRQKFAHLLKPEYAN